MYEFKKCHKQDFKDGANNKELDKEDNEAT